MEGRDLDAGPGRAAGLLVSRGGCVRDGTEGEVPEEEAGTRRSSWRAMGTPRSSQTAVPTGAWADRPERARSGGLQVCPLLEGEDRPHTELGF